MNSDLRPPFGQLLTIVSASRIRKTLLTIYGDFAIILAVNRVQPLGRHRPDRLHELFTRKRIAGLPQISVDSSSIGHRFVSPKIPKNKDVPAKLQVCWAFLA